MRRCFIYPAILGLCLSTSTAMAEGKSPQQPSPQQLLDSIIEYASPPDASADLVVVFTPDADHDLHIRSDSDKHIRGKIDKHEKGEKMPQKIFQKGSSIIAPLSTGKPVRLYLKEYQDQPGSYYPIA